MDCFWINIVYLGLFTSNYSDYLLLFEFKFSYMSNDLTCKGWEVCDPFPNSFGKGWSSPYWKEGRKQMRTTVQPDPCQLLFQ